MKDDDNNFDVNFLDPEDIIKFIPDEELTREEIDKIESISTYLESENEESQGMISKEFEENALDYVTKRAEDTRGRLAIIYTISTFIIFILGFIVSVLDSILRSTSIIQNLQVVLPLLSGIFLGLLGFVVGYYFRKEEER